MPKILIDTSYVIAAVNPRDPHHAQALSLGEQLSRLQLVVTEAVLLEIGDGLARQFRDQAVEVIESFLDSDEVEIVQTTSGLLAQAFALYKSHRDKHWGMTDCVSFVVMKENDIPDALTADRHFVQAGFKALLLGDVGEN